MTRLLPILAAAVIAATSAVAQDVYPSRPITMIVPFAPGGTSDVIARIVSEEMGNILGQRLVIENVAGAGGSTGLARGAKSPADGYTLMIGNSGTNAAAYTIYPNLPFTTESFAPVGLIAKTMPAIAIRNDFPAANLKEFLEYARKNPGKASLAHAGVGSSNYLICKAFMQAAKVDVLLIGYRGAGPALNDLMGGHVDGACDTATSFSGAIQGKQVKPLMVASPARIATLPDVPTAAEAGLPEFQQEGWNAIFAPKDTPAPVMAILNAALRKAVASARVSDKLKQLSAVPASGDEFTPEFVRVLVPKEVEKYRVLLKD